jgi:hypothetical protein
MKSTLKPSMMLTCTASLKLGTKVSLAIFKDNKYENVSGIILSIDSLDFYEKDAVTELSSFKQNSIYIKNQNAINKTDDKCNFLSPIIFNCFKESTASCE